MAAATPDRTPLRIRTRDIRLNGLKVLPAGHPLRAILRDLPDDMDGREFAARSADWIRLLKEA
jgi:hypothetical protein